jgi:hypothetical protein
MELAEKKYKRTNAPSVPKPASNIVMLKMVKQKTFGFIKQILFLQNFRVEQNFSKT